MYLSPWWVWERRMDWGTWTNLDQLKWCRGWTTFDEWHCECEEQRMPRKDSLRRWCQWWCLINWLSGVGSNKIRSMSVAVCNWNAFYRYSFGQFVEILILKNMTYQRYKGLQVRFLRCVNKIILVDKFILLLYFNLCNTWDCSISHKRQPF